MSAITEDQQITEAALKEGHLLPEHTTSNQAQLCELSPEHAAWIDLAPQVENWHPDLKGHYHANIARLGIAHLLDKETSPIKPKEIESAVPSLEDAQNIAVALEQGGAVDVSTAEELIIWGYGQEVLNNFDRVSGDKSQLSIDLLKMEGPESVMKHLENMHGLDGNFTLNLLAELRDDHA